MNDKRQTDLHTESPKQKIKKLNSEIKIANVTESKVQLSALPVPDAYKIELQILSSAIELSKSQQNMFKDHALHLGFWGFLSRYRDIPVRRLLNIFNVDINDSVTTDDELLALLKHLIDVKFKRQKRLDINTIQDVVDIIEKSKNIICLTGAGVSVSCGIPDFRSKNGIYSRLAEFQLDDPQQMFDLAYFKIVPQTFYTFAHEIYPSNFKPSPSHKFIKLLESKGKLLRNYTQNIDTLESEAGIERVIQCHGSFKTAKCIVCGYAVKGSELEKDIFNKQVPICQKCPEEVDGIMKPDITFFGEKLPDIFDTTFASDKEKVDLMIVIGSSLKVSPVADVKDKIPHHVPQILINMESLPHMSGFDVHLLGYSDVIVQDLCSRLGWDMNLDEKISGDGLNSTFIPPHVYLYNGATLKDESSDSESETGAEECDASSTSSVEEHLIDHIDHGLICEPIEIEKETIAL